MSLTPQQLDHLAGLLLTLPPGVNPLPALRKEITQIAITRCDADDMRGEKPFRRLPAFDLFLVDAQSHCWQLVDDPARASGVIVTSRPK
jgi:hypothetical protein